MHGHCKPLGSVTNRMNEEYTKIGMAMTIPAIPLLPALDIQGYGIDFYTIFLSVCGS